MADDARSLYHQLDEEINVRAGIATGFEAVLRTAPYPMEAEAVEGFRSRYRAIETFLEQALAVFTASLRGDADPEIARLALADLPATWGIDFHRRLSKAQHRIPVFFRTDEPAPGKLSEIQCCGSGWDLVELLWRLYAENREVFGRSRFFAQPLAVTFAAVLRDHLDAEPVVHHLLDNASRPHGMRYFVQRTRDEGVRYWTYDRDLGPGDCNFVRSHDFLSLACHNFFAERLDRCDRGEIAFDLPPSALFDGKLIMAWPFWSRTREHFSDDVRELFPYTTVIEPAGIELADGSRLSLAALLAKPLSAPEREAYLKYAGTDVALNWGSRGVFLANRLSRVQSSRLASSIAEDWSRGRPWVLQRSMRHREPVTAFLRDGRPVQVDSYVKWSGFYGPGGLLGIKVFHRKFHKVHGGPDTVMSIVY